MVSKAIFVFLLTTKTLYNLNAHLLHAIFPWLFIKRKGYPVAQNRDVIDFRIQRPKLSQKTRKNRCNTTSYKTQDTYRTPRLSTHLGGPCPVKIGGKDS